MMIFPNFAAARAYLESFVQASGTAATPLFALQRTQALMAYLGDPQDALPVIHLAGTSGKGSTATILAALLQAHGLRTGLGLSPHVRHLLERIQIDGAPVDEAAFCRALGEMMPAIRAMQASEWGAPTFFEILIALSYQLFAQVPVDVVIMETGLGGRYDATNTVTSAGKIALFTHIGYDHVEILGSTLTKIATQKAGIIQPHNRVLTITQAPDAQEVLRAESAVQEAQITVFDPAASIHAVEVQPAQVVFDLILPSYPPLRSLHLALTGAHQAENAGLALAAAQLFLEGMGRTLDEKAIRHALAHVTLPGRMEQRTWRGQPLILDGAHNPQKIEALCNALMALYPGQRFVFVVAFKEGKDHAAILTQLLPLAQQIILTHFENHDQGMLITAADPYALAATLPSQTRAQVTVVADVAGALAAAVTRAAAIPPAPDPVPIVVTGSLYLLAQVYAVIDATRLESS
ncbi:MAG: bifunctional folylpolyglutamate synthase/dihydrofolate synthase [Caldilineaceae bacterium]|nr:bifunctional folylpolyglutamate synthase/dihydrofolate synthase [Caldilineaceae bacterium]